MCKEKQINRTEREDIAIHAMRRWMVSAEDAGAIDKTYLFNLLLLLAKFLVPLGVDLLVFSYGKERGFAIPPADDAGQAANTARMETLDTLEAHLEQGASYGAVNWTFLKKILASLLKDVVPNILNDLIETLTTETEAEPTTNETTPAENAASDGSATTGETQPVA